MLINRLAVLLAERNIKASRVSTDTGIARSTLNSISKNESKMIQLDTINTICSYLKVSPSDFFLFTPINLRFDFQLPLDEELTNKESEIAIDTQFYEFGGDLTLKIFENFDELTTLDLSFKFKGATFGGSTPYINREPFVVEIYDDDKHNFDRLWQLKKLTPFYQEAETIAMESFFKVWLQDEAVSEIIKNEKLKPSNFDKKVVLPTAPF